MKLRLLAMGAIISVLAVIMMAMRGFGTRFVLMLAVGVVLLVVGLLRR